MKSGHDYRGIYAAARRRWQRAIRRAYDDSYAQQTPAQKLWHNTNISRLAAALKKAEAAVEAANLSTTRFVIVMPADQTILLLGENNAWTTKHSEARLFLTREEAKAEAEEGDWIDCVVNVAAFRAREDTW